MGALTRATMKEVEELHQGDATWWPGLCGAIAERGAAAVYEARNEHGWAWGALWSWIVSDAGRGREYEEALKAYAQLKGLETVAVAENATVENVGVAKLRIDTAFRFAEKVDRARWGSKVEVAGVVRVVDAGLVGRMGELLARVSAARELPPERVVNEVAQAVVLADEI